MSKSREHKLRHSLIRIQQLADEARSRDQDRHTFRELTEIAREAVNVEYLLGFHEPEKTVTGDH